MITKEEEIQLIKKVRNGNQHACKQLYSIHVDLLFRFLLQFSQDRHQIQEWTQRAFIKAFSKLDSFQFKSRFKTWLFTIGLNEMRTDKRSRFEFVEFREPEQPVSFDNNDEPEIWIKAKEAIRELTPDKKIILLLHLAEGYTHKEIGEMLSISEGASRTVLHRAKKELQKYIHHG